MLLAVMNLTLGQSVIKALPNENQENSLSIQPKTTKTRRSLCKKCYPYLYPKDKYYVLPRSTGKNRPHNVVFLLEDQKTGRPVKVAFKHGLKNDRNLRVLKGFNNSIDPCRDKPGRCVYRLINRKTLRTYRVQLKNKFKNRKRTAILKLIP
ncbi:uncharacterized protein LOC108091855 [Drosophila ficusphila]|uniref:uncharacterized protein LOC108091855 n=1 Tax=Drosophila ficusphila TaxID=30025 RepID=UPI001C89AE2F|nr:uncharacterized protein LOC108091855 [Drosophila ficusphila]